jgi:hypothetical protein
MTLSGKPGFPPVEVRLLMGNDSFRNRTSLAGIFSLEEAAGQSDDSFERRSDLPSGYAAEINALQFEPPAIPHPQDISHPDTSPWAAPIDERKKRARERELKAWQDYEKHHAAYNKQKDYFKDAAAYIKRTYTADSQYDHAALEKHLGYLTESAGKLRRGFQNVVKSYEKMVELTNTSLGGRVASMLSNAERVNKFLLNRAYEKQLASENPWESTVMQTGPTAAAVERWLSDVNRERADDPPRDQPDRILSTDSFTHSGNDPQAVADQPDSRRHTEREQPSRGRRRDDGRASSSRASSSQHPPKHRKLHRGRGRGL